MIDPATAIAAYESAKKIIEAVGIAREKASKFDRWYTHKPSEEDAKRIVAYCKHLNERRVFYFSYGDEQIESCLWSLDEVRKLTLDTMSNIEHPGAEAFLGAALDEIRAFQKAWTDFRTNRRADPDLRQHGTPLLRRSWLPKSQNADIRCRAGDL
jgi:hypothetical protein